MLKLATIAVLCCLAGPLIGQAPFPLSSPVSWPTGSIAMATDRTSVGDLNGDGRDDLAGVSGGLSVMCTSPGGGYAPPTAVGPPIAGGGSIATNAISDLNNDGL